MRNRKQDKWKMAKNLSNLKNRTSITKFKKKQTKKLLKISKKNNIWRNTKLDKK